MFLYELALELDVRSTVLLDRAHALGMNVDTTAQLTAEQVEQLRAAYGRGRGQLTQAQIDARVAVQEAESKNGSLGVGAIAALVGAGLVVVLLVGYMFTNSGDDVTTTVGAGDTTEADSGPTTTTEPCDSSSGIGVGAIGQDPAGGGAPEGDSTISNAVAATSAPAASLPPCEVVGGLSGEAIEAASTTFAGDPLDMPRDKRRFCVAAMSMVDFEMRLVEAANVDSLGPIREVMLSGRDQFKADLAQMQDSAPPRLDGPLDRYAVVYHNLLGSVSATSDEYTLAVAFLQASRTDLQYYAAQIQTAIFENCDKR